MANMLTSTMHIELFGEVSVYLGFMIKIIFCLFLGGVVGFDREIKMKAAGFKTNIMICLGATIYTSISLLNLEGGSPMIDPNRVSAQIVSGIGFLGAGAIIQSRGGITGLTTAATIWVVAAIGYTIGVGYPILATLFSFSVLLTLRLISPVAILSEKRRDCKHYLVEVLSSGSIATVFLEVLAGEDISLNQLDESQFVEGSEDILTKIYITAHPRAIDRILPVLNETIRIKKINYTILDTPVPNIQEIA